MAPTATVTASSAPTRTEPSVTPAGSSLPTQTPTLTPVSPTATPITGNPTATPFPTFTVLPTSTEGTGAANTSVTAAPNPANASPTPTTATVELASPRLRVPAGTQDNDKPVPFEWEYDGSLPSGYTFRLALIGPNDTEFRPTCQWELKQLPIWTCTLQPQQITYGDGEYEWWIEIVGPDDVTAATSPSKTFSWQPPRREDGGDDGGKGKGGKSTPAPTPGR